MDFFTMPDKAEGGFAYAYLVMILVFVAASFTVYRLKRANKKIEAEVDHLPEYEMVSENDRKK